MTIILLVLCLAFSANFTLASNQNAGICAFIAATNIADIVSFKYACSVSGIPDSDPCSNFWPNIVCNGNEIVELSVTKSGLHG